MLVILLSLGGLSLEASGRGPTTDDDARDAALRPPLSCSAPVYPQPSSRDADATPAEE
jgi:hypothetical protein